jgi:uncharacterized protein (TIGR02001 family)
MLGEMQMRKMVFAVLLLASPAPVLAEVTAQVTATSDYVWRGISQTLGGPALQAGIDYEHASGIYAGLWASNVDFFDASNPTSDPADDDEARWELDYVAGISHEFKAGWSLDVGVLYYTYPGARRDLLDTSGEGYVGLAYDIASVKVWHDLDADAWYTEANLNFEIIPKLTGGLHVGRSDLPDDDYSDYAVSLTAALAPFEVALTYTTSTLDDDACVAMAGYRNLCGGRVAVSVTGKF